MRAYAKRRERGRGRKVTSWPLSLNYLYFADNIVTLWHTEEPLHEAESMGAEAEIFS